MMQNEGIFV